LKLTGRDREIIETLAYRIRFFSVHQIARFWWSSEAGEEVNISSATRRLRKLDSEKKLVRHSHVIPPELNLIEPEFTWSPGQPEPHYGKLSWRLQSRWKDAPKPTEIYEIGPAGLVEFGGRKGGPKRLDHLRHDLHMGTVYLNLIASDSTVKERWVSEDELAPHRVGEKLPDAMLRADSNNLTTVIEFGGAYDVEHLRSFHADCHDRKLPYQMW